MQSGGSESRNYRRERWFKIAEKKGDCPHCRPHRGENYRRSHKRPAFDDWGLIPMKGKDKK